MRRRPRSRGAPPHPRRRGRLRRTPSSRSASCAAPASPASGAASRRRPSSAGARRVPPDLVLADYSLPVLERPRGAPGRPGERPADLPFIVVTGLARRGDGGRLHQGRRRRLRPQGAPHAPAARGPRRSRGLGRPGRARRKAEEELRLRDSALEAAADAIVITGLEGDDRLGEPGLHRDDGLLVRGGGRPEPEAPPLGGPAGGVLPADVGDDHGAGASGEASSTTGGRTARSTSRR